MNDENMVLMPSFLKVLEDKKIDRLFLTKDEYKKYTSIDIEGLDYSKVFKLVKKGRYENYAEIILVDGKIPDITLEYFSAINLELGFEYMPKVFKDLALLLNIVEGSVELVGNLDHISFMKEMLLSKDGVVLENGSMVDVEYPIIYKNFNIDDENYISKYFWDIRMFSLAIIQDRDYSIEERLIFLGIAYEHLSLLNDEENVDQVLQRIEELNELFKSDNMKIFFTKIWGNKYIKYDLIKELISWEVDSDLSNREYKDGVRFLKGFENRDNFKYLMDIVEENNKYLEEYLSEREYILENYIFYTVFKELIPFNMLDLKSSYLYLIAVYIMLKVQLLGLAGLEEGLDDDIVVRGLSDFYRLENLYVDKILEFMVDKNYVNMDYISLLIEKEVKNG